MARGDGDGIPPNQLKTIQTQYSTAVMGMTFYEIKQNKYLAKKPQVPREPNYCYHPLKTTMDHTSESRVLNHARRISVVPPAKPNQTKPINAFVSSRVLRRFKYTSTHKSSHVLHSLSRWRCPTRSNTRSGQTPGPAPPAPRRPDQQQQQQQAQYRPAQQ